MVQNTALVILKMDTDLQTSNVLCAAPKHDTDFVRLVKCVNLPPKHPNSASTTNLSTTRTLMLLSPLTLAACGGEEGDNTGREATQTSSLTFSSFGDATVANLPYAEATAILDINLDGKPDWFIMPASTRNSNHPIQKDAEIVTLDVISRSITTNFEFVPNLQNCSWSALATFCGVTESVSKTVDFNGEWLKVGWTQDVINADFNGDGNLDLFVSGHGREWAESWGEGSDSSRNFGELTQTEFTYPGDFIQVVIAASNPYVQQVSEYQAFWHSARVGDFDGDGYPDIIATTIAHPYGVTPSIELYKNDGTGNFNKFPLPAKREGDPNPDSVWMGATVAEMADLNGNGRDEIILPGGPFGGLEDKKIYIYELVDGVVVETQVINFPDQFQTVEGLNVDVLKISIDKLNTGDFDGDGDIDLIAKFMTSDPSINPELGGYLGHVVFENIDGEFKPFMYETNDSVLYPGDGAWFIDINNDGLLDIVHTGWPGNEDAENEKYHRDVTSITDMIWINLGDKKFQQLTDYKDVTFNLNGLNKKVGVDYKIIHWNVAEYNGENYYYIVGLDTIQNSVLEVMTLDGVF